MIVMVRSTACCATGNFWFRNLRRKAACSIGEILSDEPSQELERPFFGPDRRTGHGYHSQTADIALEAPRHAWA